MLSLYEEGQMKIKSLNGKLIWHTHYNWGLYPLVQGCRLTTFFMIWSCLLLLWWWSSFQIASIFSWQGWIHYCIWTENKYISVISFIHIIIYQDEVAWFWRVKSSQFNCKYLFILLLYFCMIGIVHTIFNLNITCTIYLCLPKY